MLPRNWNAAKYTRRYEYSRKCFWLSTCSTRFRCIMQWLTKFGDIIGYSGNRRNWENWERRTVAVNTSPQSKINYGKRFLWLWRIGFDDGGRIEMVLLHCSFDLRNHRALSRDKTKRAKNSCTEWRKTIGFCSKRDTCSFLHTHATGRREIMWKEVGDAKRSHLWKGILFSTEKRKNRLTWKAQTVWRPVLRLEFKNPLSVAVKMKKIVMWLSTSSRVSWLQVSK